MIYTEGKALTISLWINCEVIFIKTVRKDDIISKVAQETGYYVDDVRDVADAIFAAMKAEIEADHNIQYIGFGTFKIMKSRGRRYTLPNEPGVYRFKPSSRYIRFVPSYVVKGILAQNDQLETEGFMVGGDD